MNSKEFLKERKRLQGQQNLANKHGDTKLSESLGRRIAALKHDNPEHASMTLKGFSDIVEARTRKLNEDTNKITKFLKRVADDLGVRFSVKEKSTAQTDKLDHITPFAAKGQPVWMWTGEQMTGMLTFSRDEMTSSVKAIFDDESDKHLIRAFTNLKDEFFEEVDETRNLKQVKFNANFGSAKSYKKASDFTAALERAFGATAFQTHEDGLRSLVLDETGIKRLEAFMAREGIRLEGEAVEAPEVLEVPSADPDAVAPEVEADEEDTYEVEGFTLTDFMVEPELDRIAKINGGDKEVTFFRLTKTNQISFRVGDFDGRGDKRPQDMHAKVTATKGNNSAAAKKIAKHFSKVTFSKGDVDEAFDADHNLNLDLDGINEASREEFETQLAKKKELEKAHDSAGAVMKKYSKGGKPLSDDVRNSSDYKKDKANFDKAMKALQDFNKVFVKKYKKEYAAYRSANREKVNEAGNDVDVLAKRAKREGVVIEVGHESTGDSKAAVEAVKNGSGIVVVHLHHKGKSQTRIRFRDGILKTKGLSFFDKATKEGKAAVNRVMGLDESLNEASNIAPFMTDLYNSGMQIRPDGSKSKAPLIDSIKEAIAAAESGGTFEVSGGGKTVGAVRFVKGEVKLAILGKKSSLTGKLAQLLEKYFNKTFKLAEEMTQPEAIKLAKKAMKAGPEQKEALMGILNNVGYIVKSIGGKKKLVKGNKEVSLEALKEARAALAPVVESDESHLVPFLKDLYKAGMFISIDMTEASHLAAAETMKRMAAKGGFTAEVVDDQDTIVGAVVFGKGLDVGTTITQPKHKLSKKLEELLKQHFGKTFGKIV